MLYFTKSTVISLVKVYCALYSRLSHSALANRAEAGKSTYVWLAYLITSSILPLEWSLSIIQNKLRTLENDFDRHLDLGFNWIQVFAKE